MDRLHAKILLSGVSYGSADRILSFGFDRCEGVNMFSATVKKLTALDRVFSNIWRC